MPAANNNQYLRRIPSVDEILNTTDVQALLLQFSHTMIVKAIHLLLTEKRNRMLSMKEPCQFEKELSLKTALPQIKAKIREIEAPSLKHVINASGIVVHTNLGRAPLAEDAVKAICGVAGCYSNLEFDLKEGKRGSRYDHVESLLRELSGSEAGLAVNNNAAAVLLCLSTLAQGKQVIISRGELVEIGGSFRIPDIMKQSGATLVEVGSTNRTHLRDYREAINEQTAIILKVHMSNYRIVGFSSEVGLSELNKLGSEHNIPVMFDMGSGNLIDSSFLGLTGDLTVQDTVKSGTDIITFSGDKLLGGPQAGIILGRDMFIQKIKRNPLARVVRIDKLTLAALESTLKNYAHNPEHIDNIPVIRMLAASESLLKKRAKKIVKAVKEQTPFQNVSLTRDTSQVGGGAYPLHDLPTWVVSIDPAPLALNEFENLLRTGTLPIVARISKERILLDMRTILPDEVSLIPGCIVEVAKSAKAQLQSH